MNTITIIGRLGRDAEVSMVGDNKDLCLAKFVVGVNDPMSKTEDVDWIKCRQFRCDNLAPYLTVGKLVAVQGRLKVDSYTDKATGENRTTSYILVERTELLADGKKEATDFTEKVEKKAPVKSKLNTKGTKLKGKGMTKKNSIAFNPSK